MSEVLKAVILAGGLGTRMRSSAGGGDLDDRQGRVADTGVKGLIPFDRPFLDYLISALADAGIQDVCIVIGPQHQAVRERYTHDVVPGRVRVAFAVQAQPLGTADAVAAAERFTRGEPFLAVNSDNYYPVPVLGAVRQLRGCGLAGFDREALVREGNVDDARVSRYAVIEMGSDGRLIRISEKPNEAAWARLGRHALISMNCWRFNASIFAAARRIGRSARGELELTDAVQAAMNAGETFEVVPVQAGVLDLSRRGDIPSVARRLAGVEVRL